MTVPTKPEHSLRYAYRLVARAYAVTQDPENMEKRRAFAHATFNIDWTAAAIVALAHMEPLTEPPTEP